VNLRPDQIRWILIEMFVLIASVTIHEFGHAAMANFLGDDTPRRQGRVTLNPLAHADPIGTLLLPLIGSAYAAAGGGVGGFGWGRPVQWNPSRIARKWKMSTAKILVAMAGPSMNVVLAVLVAVTHAILLSQHVVSFAGGASTVMLYAVMTNFVLFFFNLMPAPPLDGGWIVDSLTPYNKRAQFEAFARMGPFIVGAFMLVPQLAQVFLVPAKFCASHLYGLLGVSII
jgi:Zn-dependent protease